MIYNIEKTELITDNDVSYILGGDEILFTNTLNDSLNNIGITFDNIKCLIIYDRKRDEIGNVIKDNIIIDRYCKWYQSIQNMVLS